VSAVRLRAATAADLPWLVGLEQSPANASFLCAWPADRHARGMADPDKRYLVFEDAAGARRGFAILAGLRSRERAVELVRVAVDAPGQGLGTAALRRLVGHVFGELGAARLFLDVFDDNPRARRAYRGLGFREERVLPAAARRQDGTVGNLVIMGMAPEDRPRAG
jgi:diamine N-acetyltransferase